MAGLMEYVKSYFDGKTNIPAFAEMMMMIGAMVRAIPMDEASAWLAANFTRWQILATEIRYLILQTISCGFDPLLFILRETNKCKSLLKRKY